ncbi:MAG: MerR family transcriptional regulator [Gammaproteobacteria bacterium]|nr:MAG: MerR family transcriptional regulator [Gammaproteobacteria bacterium]
MESLSIGQLAKAAQVNVETVRYYEREGLLPRPARRASGYRRYPSATVTRLQFIKRSKELGFSLKEIAELLALRIDPHSGCADVKRRAEAKLADIERKLTDLRRMRRALTQLVHDCGGEGPSSACPILDTLEGLR